MGRRLGMYTRSTRPASQLGITLKWLICRKWNSFAWLFGAPPMGAMIANVVMDMWGLSHLDLVVHHWHAFVVYAFPSWMCCGAVSQAFVDSFVVLTTASYVVAILTSLLTRRRHISSRLVSHEGCGWSGGARGGDRVRCHVYRYLLPATQHTGGRTRT